MKQYFKKPTLIFFALLATTALALSGCGPNSDPSSEPEALTAGDPGLELTPRLETLPVKVWSYRPEAVTRPVLAAFTEASGIPTEHRILRGDEILEVLPRTEAGDRPDLLLTVDALRFAELDAGGLLAPIDASALAAVPPTMRHAQGHWAGISWRVRGLVQRRDEAIDLDWTDLPVIAAAGRLCVRPGRHIYNRSLLAWQILRLGEDSALAWAEAIHGVPAIVDDGDQAQIVAIAEGRCDVAIVNHYYLARMRAGDDENLREAANQVLFGNPGQSLALQPNISGIALVADSPNRDGGLALASWMLNPDNQGVYAQPTAEFPISRPQLDLPLGEALDAFEAVEAEAPWPSDLAQARSAAERFFGGDSVAVE